MSLAAAALRIAAVKALTGATSAGNRVYDSEVDPIELLGDKAMPTIIVYTDVGRIDLVDKSLIEAPHYVALTFEEFIGRAVKVQTDDTNGATVDLEIPAKDAAYENYLQTLAYERHAALLRADESPWPDLFRRLWVRGAHGHPSEWDRGANAEKARFAFRREVLWLETIDDPVRGQALPAIWSDLLAAMDSDADAGIVKLAAYWRALITAPAVSDWRAAQEALGITDGAMRIIGIAPPDGVDSPAPGAVPAATEAQVEDQGSGSVLIVDEDPPTASLIDSSGTTTPIVETP